MKKKKNPSIEDVAHLLNEVGSSYDNLFAALVEDIKKGMTYDQIKASWKDLYNETYDTYREEMGWKK